MAKVKVCGITNLEDALSSLNADALGFVFYEKSPRYISPSDARKIIKKLPPFIEKTALFVNHTPTQINEIMRESSCTLAQLHFEVDDSFTDQLNVSYIKVIRCENKEQLDSLSSNNYYLIDAYVESYGGEGKRLNLEWFQNRDNSKTILAGGLSVENLDELNGYGFYGVDASSSLEISKGKKDTTKVKKFIDKAKNI